MSVHFIRCYKLIMLNIFINFTFMIVLIPQVIRAKLRISVSDSDYVDNNDVLNFSDDYYYDDLDEEPIRVVDASQGLDKLFLRFATLKEKSTLEKHVGHIMEGYKYKVQGISKSFVSSAYEETSFRVIRTELETTINNFLLSLPLDPDQYNPDITNEDTDILIFYRDYIEILVIRSGQQQWNYILGAHSTLPEWFYENYVTDKQDIPDIIKKQFFIRLISKIKTLSNNLHL